MLYLAVILYLIVIASIYFQSLLIQGKGKFNCSSSSLTADTCNTSNPECSPYAITVIPRKTYRLRVASLTALSALSFQIEVTFMNAFTIKSFYAILSLYGKYYEGSSIINKKMMSQLTTTTYFSTLIL